MVEVFLRIRCPRCRSLNTFRRRGVHFDHERKCQACGNIYDPDDEEVEWVAQEAERVALSTLRE